ncbi:MAG: sigma-54-dependent Fis family transcriptional regulator [Deltaproteobacteria bacterium]|nr:sigma-54-dependent Fis family transcriptional regulator [Deltaproteobacteria bacterium]MBW2019572.1 sigma-54-dependent Fis family transcriptional regulator [Deltaproteobacteria bacterium]MBW2074406.1 sigma-54-dependent Fis family transcriptional regulator [Deltaproteobacteria bacterium]RLB82858.1 MAG: sigma-54-dependent Fis family transcriptional regulator [Deltaproteobacteria bacterium]
MKAKLLVVDDEADMLNLLKRSIGEDLDCHVETALSGEEAFRLIERKPFDLALVDIRMPGMDGIELLERIKQVDPWLTVVMMTAYGVIEVAVESIKKGAYDFITKPFDQDDLIRVLRKALERSRLLRENLNLRKRIKEEDTFQNFIGVSPRMQKVYDTIQMLSKTDVTVLITGESGTGKNLAAKAIHALSHRSAKPYVRVSCPTLPENILESELFGYKKGAFTHATQDKKGLFEEAHGGTIYLDEIGDISPSIQTKLLQVLEDKEMKPLGQTKTICVDVRVIASTNSDLRSKMDTREFREDLFYRLNVVNVEMPPLRERKEDIPLLVHHFLDKYCTKFNRKKKQISSDLMQLFLERNWEGNVRELKNTIKGAVVMAPEDWIRIEDIGWHRFTESQTSPTDELSALPYREAKQRVLKRFNVNYISNALRQTSGNVTKAAQQCGLERQSLQQIMKKCGIKSIDFR